MFVTNAKAHPLMRPITLNEDFIRKNGQMKVVILARNAEGATTFNGPKCRKTET